MKRSRKVSKEPAKRNRKKMRDPKPTKPATGVHPDMRRMVHLLQVNQIELEHQNQELKIAERELEESRSKYVDLFDFSPTPYFALDFTGVIKEVNLSAARMLGVDRNKLIGRNITVYIPHEDRHIAAKFLQGVFRSPEKCSCTLRMKIGGKRVFDVQLDGVRSNHTLETEPRCQVALIESMEHRKLEKASEELTEELKSLKAARGGLRS